MKQKASYISQIYEYSSRIGNLKAEAVGIVKGEKHEVMGINIFDTKVQMQPRDIKKIAHGFGEVEDDDDEKITESVTLGHVLDNIFFSTPLHKYENIAFLDTPGYSKPDSEKYSAKTDEQIARGQLNSSNYILYFLTLRHLNQFSFFFFS